MATGGAAVGSADPSATAMAEERTREGDRLVVLGAVAALAIAAVGVLALWLPYVRFGSISASLADAGAGDPDRLLDVVPRLVGTGLVVVTGVLTLALPRARILTWWSTAGALLGLCALWAHRALGFLLNPGPGAEHGIAMRLDLVLPLAGLAAVAAGSIGALRSSRSTATPELHRPHSAPYVVVATAAAALVALWLTTRSILFVPSLALGDRNIWTDSTPLDLRLLGIAAAALLVAVPVLAAWARDPRLTIGLAVGWVAYAAVLAVPVVSGRRFVPDGIEATFVLGALLVVVTAAGLVAWARITDRAGRPGWRPSEQRRARAELG